MTLTDIERLGKEMLTPADVAGYLGADPQAIRLQARSDPKALGFPVICIGTRVHIPREGFVRFCRACSLYGEAQA